MANSGNVMNEEYQYYSKINNSKYEYGLEEHNYLVKINSMMIAILLNVTFIALIFASLNLVNEGIVPIILFTILIISYISALYTKKLYIKINVKTLFFILGIITIFLITFLFRGTNITASEYFSQFLAFGVITYLLMILPFKIQDVIRFTMLISLIFLINPIEFLNFISVSEASYQGIEMGATYALLPSVVAAVIHFFFFQNKRSFLNLLGYILNLYLLIIILSEGSRGATLAILLLFCFVIYIKINMKTQANEMKIFPLLFAAFLSLTTIIILNLEGILLSLYQVFREFGIDVTIINKTYELILGKGLFGILNGRDLIYANALDLFYDSPIWGHGIGAFSDIYGRYPHNVFLQILVEGGLLFMLPMSIILILCFWYLIKSWSSKVEYNKERYLLLLVFILCMPKLMLSSHLWQQQSFWLMILLLLSVDVKANRGFKPLEIENNKEY